MTTYRLFVGKRFSGISIEPDPTWPAMWRVRQGERLSGMLNLTRAADAGRACAQPKGGGFGDVVVKWVPYETAKVSAPIEFEDVA
jgi:hypothetical protein